MSQGSSEQTRPFGNRDVLSYALGDVANDLTFALVTTFFMLYATNVAGIDAGHVGTIFLVVRLVDAFFDLWWGRYIDSRPEIPEGKFKPWVRRMAPIVLVLSVVCFLPFTQGWSYPARLTFVAASYFCYGISYSGVNIPYGSMSTAISANPRDRSQLSVGRSVGAIVGSAVPMVVLPLFVYTTDAAGKQVLVPGMLFAAAVVCALISAAAYWGCYRGSVERVRGAALPRHKPLSLGQLIASMVSNRGLLALIVGSVVLLFILGILQAMAPYLWLDYFGNGSLQSLSGLAIVVPTVLLAPFATRLAHRYGKKELVGVGVTVSAVAALILFATQTTSPVLLLTLISIAGLGAGMQTVLAWALIADVIDYHEVHSGQRDDATVYAAYVWARKVGQAIASGMGGWLLARVGYVSSTGEPVQQSEATLKGIYMISTLVPGVLFVVLAVVMIWWYPLSKHDVEDNAAILERWRREKPADDALPR